MKKMLLLTLASLLLLLTGCAFGLKQPPKTVRQAFDSQFPGASHVEWERVMSTYKAEFYHDGHEKEAQFDKDGSWSPPTTRSNTTGSIRTARSSSSCSRTGPFSPESDP